MQVKRYEVASIEEAAARIKADLGPDAVILSTKRINGGSGRLEVVAGRDDTLPRLAGVKGLERTPSPPREAGQEGGLREELAGLRREVALLREALRETAQGTAAPGDWHEVKERLDTLFDLFGLRGEAADPLVKLYRHLTAMGISKERAAGLLAEVKQGGAREITSYEAGLLRAEQCISRRLAAFGNQGPNKRVKAFFGPTGVGKTTTIAKLASLCALKQKASVGLVTTDTYRIAAVEQLKTYARIIGIPLEVAPDREALKRSLERLADRDVIFIDTPGKNCRDDQYLQHLREMFCLSVPLEANLLLSTTASEDSLSETGRRFGIIPYDRIILTKTDECPRAGFVFNVIERLAKPVAYVTTGQNVPFDIEKADPARTARLIVRNTLH